MRLGLHIATKGDVIGTPARAKAMGAETMQIFASNPRGWRPTTYSSDKAERFIQAARDNNISPVWFHMIYLVSYGTPDDELRGKSITALSQTLASADLLAAKGVVTHLGSHKGLGLEQALSRLGQSLQEALLAAKQTDLLLENSAGAGGNIGNSLEELAKILEVLKGHSQVKFCLDTAHALTSGYEIRSDEGLEKFLAEFDRLLGLDRLALIHINDSKADLGTHVDRHENIGFGTIGDTAISRIINHPKLAGVSAVLEVPGMDGKSGPDEANMQHLLSLRRASAAT